MSLEVTPGSSEMDSLAIWDHMLTDMVLTADLVVRASKQQMPMHYHYHSKARQELENGGPNRWARKCSLN